MNSVTTFLLFLGKILVVGIVGKARYISVAEGFFLIFQSTLRLFFSFHPLV